MNETTNEENDVQEDEVLEQPKVRGYTYAPHTWAISSAKSKPLEIEFNKFGQPIGRHKSKYVEFLGTIVRNGNLAPLTYTSWLKVPDELKDDMMVKVRGSFNVPKRYDKIVKKELGRLWRAFKARIKKKYFDPKASMEKNLRNKGAVDERVKENHWKFLVEYWCTTKAKDTSDKNKENRSMKKMHHITGKRSFAQIYEREMNTKETLNDVALGENDMDVEENDESGITDLTRADIFAKCYSRDGNTSNPEVANALEKIKELQCQRLPGAPDKGPTDIYSQVLGEDKGGRVRMFGYGVTSKEVYGGNSFEEGDDIHRITMEKESLKKQLEERDRIIERLMRNENLRGVDHQNITNISSSIEVPSESVRNEAAPKSAPQKTVRKSAPCKSAHTLAANEPVRTLAANEPGRNLAANDVIRNPAANESARNSEYKKSTHNSAPKRLFVQCALAESARSGTQDELAQPPNTDVLIQVGRKVIVKGFLGDVIAKGFVESVDPTKLVGKEELGPEWCEVKVTVAIKPEQHLVRKNGNVKVIGQAIGSSIAWPMVLVQVERPS